MNPVPHTARRPGSTDDAPPRSEVIQLPADCSLRNIDALKERLCAVGDGVQYVTLDLRLLERFDTATLQLIAAFAREHAVRGATLMTCGNRQSWDEAVELLGLTATLSGKA